MRPRSLPSWCGIYIVRVLQPRANAARTRWRGRGGQRQLRAMAKSLEALPRAALWARSVRRMTMAPLVRPYTVALKLGSRLA